MARETVKIAVQQESASTPPEAKNDSRRSPRRRGRKSELCDLMPSNVIEHRLRSKIPAETKHSLPNIEAESENELEDAHDPLALMTVGDMDEPSSYREAINGPEADQWRLAMQEEMDSLAKNGTWTMECNTGRQQVVDNRWVFKRKLDADGNITRYKARLVARGFSQE